MLAVGPAAGSAPAASGDVTAGAGEASDMDAEEPDEVVWTSQVAKKRKNSAGVLFDGAGDASSDAARAAEYASANLFEAAQMTSFAGGRTRSPSLFPESGRGRANEKRWTQIGLNWSLPTTRTFGACARASRFGCSAVGSDNARRSCFHPGVSDVLASRPAW